MRLMLSFGNYYPIHLTSFKQTGPIAAKWAAHLRGTRVMLVCMPLILQTLAVNLGHTKDVPSWACGSYASPLPSNIYYDFSLAPEDLDPALAERSTSSSLRITDRSFRYASPCLWNQLPNSFRQRHSSPSVSDFPADAPATSSYSLNLPLSPSITPSPFHSRLKTYLFSQTIILAVDRRSRISTSIFTSGRSRQYLWSNNCISHSSLCCYIARRTLFIIAPY